MATVKVRMLKDRRGLGNRGNKFPPKGEVLSTDAVTAAALVKFKAAEPVETEPEGKTPADERETRTVEAPETRDTDSGDDKNSDGDENAAKSEGDDDNKAAGEDKPKRRGPGRPRKSDSDSK